MTQPELQQHKDHHRHEYDASPSLPGVVSDLWDEFWFFQNCLTNGRPNVCLSFNPTPQTLISPVAKATGTSGGAVVSSAASEHRQPLTRHQSLSLAAVDPAPARQTLMKAPSLPLDIGNHQQQGQEEDDPTAVSDSHKLSGNKLQRSYSSMQHSSCKAYLAPRSHRPPRNFTLEAHWIAPNKASYRHHCHQSIPISSSRVKFQVKKWKSLTDLEHEEVQGFKDLGFVFNDTGGQLSPVLLKMIPGLRSGMSSPDGDSGSTPKDVSRPYLSEAWLMQRSAPPVLTWDGRGLKSPAHMKEKLRFWARAVASNVRQEC